MSDLQILVSISENTDPMSCLVSQEGDSFLTDED